MKHTMNKKLFAAMSRRRVSCPQVTQQLWDAINIIREQRQVPNVERISRYMSRVHQINEDEVKRQLNHCVRDGLVRLTKRVGFKGSQIGVEQEGYRLPTGTLEKDGHDWYCFECHRGGDVICCTSCHRVYHLACIAKEELPDEDVKNTFVCTVCKKMSADSEEKVKIKRSQLNHLLGFTCTRLKERLPTCLTDRAAAPPPRSPYAVPDRTGGGSSSSDLSHNATSERWRAAYLIYRPMDLKSIESKASSGKYRALEEFKADAQTIVHNVVIYHGVHSSLADMARQMLRDCVYDLTEIRQCRDCYRVSNEKKDKHWFCEPCKPPHQLVYAKQKGFPYWPAKVIKVEGDQYDVRFFGGYHQRALIEKVHIRPISVNIHTLQLKRTSAWNKACEELKRHQELLQKMESKESVSSSSEDEDVADSLSDEEKENCKKMGKISNDLKSEDDDDDDDEDEDEEEEEEEDKEVLADKEENIKVEKKRSSKINEGSKLSVSPEEGDSSISSSSRVKCEPKKDGGPSLEDNVVTSSSQEPRSRSVSVQTPARLIKEHQQRSLKEVEKNNAEAIAKARAEFESEKHRLLVQLEKKHAEELRQIADRHKQAISEVKRKQWCYNCESEAIYHCCWNTAYCSTDCQQLHWNKEHKRVCRRKR